MAESLLLTGAAGFIGSHLARALLGEGARVVGVDNFDGFYDRAAKESNVADLVESDDFELVEADIRDAAAMTGLFARVRPAAVFHMAALAGVRPSIAAPARYAAVNVEGLVNVLEAARGSGCRRVVFASSSSVYGDRAAVPFSEDDVAVEPISPYAATKRSGELVCSAYCHLYGLSIAALRFFTVYGPGQRPDLAICQFMKAIARDEPITMFGDGTSSRDYTYIDDIVQGVVAAGRRTGEAEPGLFRIYNLGGASPVTLADMIAAIGAVVGRAPRVAKQPMQSGDVMRTCADVTRSAAELGFRAKVSFEDGLERQWTWLRGRLE